MIAPQALIDSADEIDSRLGPIPGTSSDRIARELRTAAELIQQLQQEIASVAASRQPEQASHE